jgi:3-hydroxybutyryl-CoA dehydrogenase
MISPTRNGRTLMSTDWMKRAMVIGAGTMGHSIAMVFAQGGYEVDLVDLSETLLGKAVSLIQANLRTLGKAGLIDSRAIPRTLGRIHPSTSLAAGKEADLVIEAISEAPEAKKKLFRSLDGICPARTIFASNTSYLNIFQIAKKVRPEKLLITHWWAPPHLIPLVDMVKGPKTSAETVERVRRLLLKLGKKPVVMKRFIPGYIVNRLQRAMAREIFHLLDGGYATPEDIDTAVKNSLGIRIPAVGIVQRYDFTGLDLALSFEKNPSIHLVSKDVLPKSLSRLVKKGHLGVKTGRGFYDYGSKTTAEILRERDVKLIELLKFIKRWDSNP